MDCNACTIVLTFVPIQLTVSYQSWKLMLGVFQRAHLIMEGMQVIPEITSGVSVEFVALCTVN